MRFKIDENLHDDVAKLLAGKGHDAQTVHDEGLRGADDQTIAAHALADGRAILTLDLDFADIRAFPPSNTAGILVLRVHDQSRRHMLNVVRSVLALLDTEPVAGRLWIISESGVRIRGV